MAGHDLGGKAASFGQGLILPINDFPYRCHFLAREHLAQIQRKHCFDLEPVEADDHVSAFA